MDAAETRRMAERIAKEVMGWALEGGCDANGARDAEGRFWILDSGDQWSRFDNTFHPLTNPSDDYRVLQRVRETWTMSATMHLWDEFNAAARRLWQERAHTIDGWWAYEPGDYSRVALAALEGE